MSNRYAFGTDAVAAAARVEELKGRLAAATGALEEAEAALATVDEQRRAAMARVEDARSAVNELARAVVVAQGPLHPVRKIPPEVLALVFEQCFEPLALEKYLSFERDDLQQPFRLAAVCRSWRAASLASARAWAVLDLDLDKVSTASQAVWKNYLSTMIARSGKTSLSLRIKHTKKTRAYHKPFLDTLARSVLPRCVEIFLDFSRYRLINDILTPWLLSPTPILRALHIRGMDSGVYHSPNTKYFPNAVALQTLVIDQRPLPEWSIATVTTASLHSPSAATLQSLSAAAPNITSLTLCDYAFIRDIIQPPVALASVTQLVLVFEVECDTSYCLAFANSYAFPRVRDLSLRRKGERRLGTVCAVYLDAALKAKQFPLLERLSLPAINEDRSINLNLSISLKAIATCTTLRRLEITDAALRNNDFNSFHHALRSGNDGTWPCPNLEELVFTSSCRIKEGSQGQGLLASIAENRMNAARSGDQVAMMRVLFLPLGADEEVVARINAALRRS